MTETSLAKDFINFLGYSSRHLLQASWQGNLELVKKLLVISHPDSLFTLKCLELSCYLNKLLKFTVKNFTFIHPQFGSLVCSLPNPSQEYSM